MIVLYRTKNVALATITDTILLFASEALMSFLDSIPVIKFYHLNSIIVSFLLFRKKELDF